MDVEGSPSCNRNFVEIRQQYSTLTPDRVYGRYCGIQGPRGVLDLPGPVHIYHHTTKGDPHGEFLARYKGKQRDHYLSGIHFLPNIVYLHVHFNACSCSSCCHNILPNV